MLNGRQTGVLGTFTERDGALYATASELNDLGFKLDPGLSAKDTLVALATLPGVNAKIDEASQTIVIEASDMALRPQEINGPRDFRKNPEVTRPMVGLMLNYDILGTKSQGQTSGGGEFDARVFGPYGTFSTTALSQFAPIPGQGSFVRLDTDWIYADPDTLRRYTVGDVITSSLSATRPIRIGGVQIGSDFTLRPDLVTFPLPRLSGSTAVPTTVDVLVNGVRQLSQPVTPGPFEIRSAPIVTGAGEVAIAYQDALGRQVITTVPFYASSSLLEPGLSSYSVDIGLLRQRYSEVSDQYGQGAIVGTIRRGMSDDLTLEGHVEATSELGMATVGTTIGVGTLGIIAFSGSGSTGRGKSGWMAAADIQRSTAHYNISLSGTLASGGYNDIAGLSGTPVPHFGFRVAGGVQLGSLGSIGVAYVRQLPFSNAVNSLATGGASISLATVTYQTELTDNLNFYATGYVNPRATDPDTGRPAMGYGAMLGLSLFLDNRYSIDASASNDSGRASYVVQASKSATETGEYGFSLIDSEGYARRRLGQFEYDDEVGVVTLGVDQSPAATSYRAGVSGSLVIGGGDVFAARSIPDSFAIVRTGDIEGVGVSYENRPIGKTNSSGELLLPDLRAYQANRITLTSTDLPPDVSAGTTDVYVRPPTKSGVLVDFDVKDSRGALVRLQDGKGRPLPVGSSVERDGADFAVVGFDGEVYLTELEARNSFQIQMPDGSKCNVSVPYHHVRGDLPVIGPLRCQ